MRSQFVRRRVGGEHRQVREAAVAGGVAGAGLGQRVVVGAGKVDARLARHKVGARAGDGQHLDGDAAGVHVGEAGVAKVGEFVAFGGLRPDEVGAGEAAAGDRVGGDAGDDAGNGVVFFQGDDAHVVFLPCGWAGGWHGGCAGATWAPLLVRKNAGMPARPLVRLQTDCGASQITRRRRCNCNTRALTSDYQLYAVEKSQHAHRQTWPVVVGSHSGTSHPIGSKIEPLVKRGKRQHHA